MKKSYKCWIAEGLEGFVKKEWRKLFLHDSTNSFVNFLCDRHLIETFKTDKGDSIAEEHKGVLRVGKSVSHFPIEEDNEGWPRMSVCIIV